MAVSLYDSVSAIAATTTLSITPPSGSTGKFAVVFLVTSDANSITTPSGWTRFDYDTDGNMRFGVYYRTLASGAAVSFVGTTTDKKSALMYVFDGVDLTTPINTSETPAEAVYATSSTTRAIPSATVAGDRGAVTFVGSRGSAAPSSWTSPSPWADAAEAYNTSSGATTAAGAFRTYTSGSVGGGNWTANASEARAVVYLIILNPAATAIAADTSVVTLAGVTSDLGGSGMAATTLDAASFTIEGVTPVVTGSGAAAITVDSAELMLAGVTPTTVTPVVITVESAALAIVGQDAVLAGFGVATIAADVAILALAGQDSTSTGVSASLEVDAALLTLSGQTPPLTGSGQAGATVAVDAGILTLGGTTPVMGGGPILVHIDVALLELVPVTPSPAGTSVSMLVDPAALLLAGMPVILAPSDGRDITVTGDIDTRRWDAVLTPRNKTGSLSPRRWEGRI